MNPSTVMFWLSQSQEARDAIRFSATDIRSVLTEFNDFVSGHSSVKTMRPWGNASGFDLTILSGAYERAGMKAPWHYLNERCFRTVRNMYPAIEYNPDDKGTGAHNALLDATFQAQHLFSIKNRNR